MTIEEFVASYFPYNRISLARQKAYLRGLRSFEEYQRAPIAELNPVAFRSWLGEFMTQGAHVNTVRFYAQMVRTYARHAWKMGELDADTFMRISEVENPRGASGLTEPDPYDLDELHRIWRWIDIKYPAVSEAKVQNYYTGKSALSLSWTHFMRLQVRAIVYLALDCGMRRSEIYGASVDDISPENEVVLVRMGKSKIDGEPRYREVPHTPRSREAVREWLNARSHLMAVAVAPEDSHPSPWLVLRKPQGSMLGGPIGSQMSKQSFGGLIKPWRLHRLRHTSATMWLRAGMPLEKVSKMLGHATLQQTLCYAKLNRQDIVMANSRALARYIELTKESPT